MRKNTDTMERFTKDDVLASLQELLDGTTWPAAAAQLGVSKQFLYSVLHEKKPLPAGLAFKLGYLKLPDAYVRKPKK